MLFILKYFFIETKLNLNHRTTQKNKMKPVIKFQANGLPDTQIKSSRLFENI